MKKAKDHTMNRRRFMTAAAPLDTALTGGHSLLGANDSTTSEAKGLITTTSKLTPPRTGGVAVALLISAGLNVVDFAGPWGVFDSARVPGATEPPFHLFTVSETAETVTSSSGLKIKPDYTFANMPETKVVVIPAQMGTDAMIEWLRQSALKMDVTMSVCTGAFKLAKAGLLAGQAATTHHEFLDKLQKEYPDIEVKRGVRFVENEKISTAGGLTSGTDLALRVVERYFGREAARNTAAYMEYHGQGWIV